MPEVSIFKLRHQIMKERGLTPPKPTKLKLPLVLDHSLPEEEIPLHPKMRYIELKYGVKVKTNIFIGSLTDVCSRYKWEVDRSTISRWRKYIKRFLVEGLMKETGGNNE